MRPVRTAVAAFAEGERVLVHINGSESHTNPATFVCEESYKHSRVAVDGDAPGVYRITRTAWISAVSPTTTQEA